MNYYSDLKKLIETERSFYQGIKLVDTESKIADECLKLLAKIDAVCKERKRY